MQSIVILQLTISNLNYVLHYLVKIGLFTCIVLS